MDDYITRREFDAIRETMEKEHEILKKEDETQNRRIDKLEKALTRIDNLAANTERLATNMENMLKAQERQGKRIDVLESRDGEQWRKVVGYVITAIIGIVLGFVFKQIGM